MLSRNIPKHKISLKKSISNQKAVTFIEVMVAMAISAIVSISAIASVIYYQRVSNMNHRLATVANLIESQMEEIKNQTWFSINQDDWFDPDPNDERAGAWPAPGDFSDRALAKQIELVSDAPPADLIEDYRDSFYKNFTGLTARLEVFYTPFTITHEAEGVGGATLEYDVRYYKVEVAVTLDGAQRIRFREDMDPVEPGMQDVWTAVTYISELSARGDAEFSTRNLDRLRERRE